MNKLFSKIAALSVGLAMAVGVGVAVSSNNDVAPVHADSSITGYDPVSSISAGDVVYFTYVAGGVPQVLTSVTSGTKGDVTAISNKTMNTTYPLTVGKSGDYYTFKDKNNKYIAFTSTATSSNNKLWLVDSDSADGATWTVSFDGTTATIKNVYNDSRTLRGNTNSGQYRICGYSTTTGVLLSLYKETSAASTMVVKNSSGNVSPFAMSYGDLSGQLFYAYEEDGTTPITSGVTWSVSDPDILVLVTDYPDNHCWVKPGTKAGEATLVAAKTNYNSAESVINVNKGDLESIAVSGSMSNTNYAVNSAWNPAGLVVTATYSTGYEETVSEGVSWSYEPATPNSTSVTSVVATATYSSEQASSAAQAVTVFAGTTYDFVTNFATYASSWNNSYTTRTVNGKTDLGASYDATITFNYASKQGSTISDRPVPAAKSGVVSTMLFQLDSSVSETYNITTVAIAFQRWSATKEVAASIYKGTTVSGDALDSFAQTDAPRNLTVSNLNGDSFIVDFTTDKTQNQQIGVTSITIGLAEKSSFGTLDHIKVTALPNTIYHVGEEFDAAGLQITAYDNADESKAAYKDVTAEATYSVNDGHAFAEEEVPTITNTVTYEGKETSFDISVFALAEYELVEEAPTNWAGNYLLVASYTDGESVEHTVALNSALVNFDQPGNFKEVTVTDGVISTGQECEFVVAPYSSGYSMQGKNGKYAYGSGTYRFQASDEPKELSLAFAENIVTVTGASSYNLKLSGNDESARFGFYDKAVSNISFYRLKASSAADEYAQTFLGAFACDESGETAPSFNIKEGTTPWSWSLLKAEYNKLTAAEKEEFRLGAASETGDNIAQALARYDYVVGKYGKATFEDFMLRDPAPIAQGAGSINSNANSSTSFIIVIVASALTISAFSLVLVIRKRRHIK